MASTLTIRLPEAQREALKKRAGALKKTESALIRELVAREISMPDWDLVISKLAGSVDSREDFATGHPLQEHLRLQNWRS